MCTIVANVLHEVFLLELVLLEDHVVETESKNHGDQLVVLGGFLEVGEHFLELLDLTLELGDLEVQDFFGLLKGGLFVGNHRLSKS